MSVPTPQDISPPNVPLLARARYNNVAEVVDELSFRQGDIVTVLKKDFNGQVDWWLCEMRGRVGMVPANYFEIFHDAEATYDVPRTSARTTPISRQSHRTDVRDIDDDEATYDIPPSVSRGQSREREHHLNVDVGNDYDFPPPEHLATEAPDYDCPSSRPESARSSLKSGSASGILLHRLSQASASSGGTSSSQIYDVPPTDLAEVYDLPKSEQPTKGFEEEEKGQMLMAVDIQQIKDDEAEEMLGSYCKLVKVTYESLFQTVYGSDAYWGTDNMPLRNETLQMTIQATRQFDRALTALLEFGKGVANSLESSHDMNFKKKYSSHYRGLLQKRQEILSKLDALSLNNETTTATVKSLLENARVVPNSVNEFVVLVKANKAVLFQSSSKPTESLPVLTKTEVKARPLPELPPTPPHLKRESSSYDYAYISSDDQDPPPRPPKPPSEGADSTSSKSHHSISAPSLNPSPHPSPSRQANNFNPQSDLESSLDYSCLSRKRTPQDTLPPLPFATVPRPPKKPLPAETSVHYTPVRGRSPTDIQCTPGRGPSPISSLQVRGQSPTNNYHHTPVRGRSPTNVHCTPVRGRSPTSISYTPVGGPSPNHSGTDITINGRQSPMSVSGDFFSYRQRSNCLVSRDSPLHRPRHVRNQSYDSNLSDGSSCDMNDLRRARSTDLLDGPYGRATTPSHQPRRTGSPQPLRREERELLERFSKQMELITPSLRESIDVLLDSISVKEPPKEFVTKSKLTVVAAYKLVYVADALCQKIIHNETKTTILSSSNLLTESIKGLVSDTKSAALQYPSVLALEKMNESLKQIFPSALDLVESIKSRANFL